jgi:hypothetical protein
MDDKLRQQLHETFDVYKPSSNLTDRVLASIQPGFRAGHGWRREVIGTACVLIAAAVVISIVIAVRVGRNAVPVSVADRANQETVNSTSPLPICNLNDVQLSMKIQRDTAISNFIVISASTRGAPCSLEMPVTLTIRDLKGQPLPIVGNGVQATLNGNLPRDAVLTAYVWSNWCGPRSVLLKTSSEAGQNVEAQSSLSAPCADTAGEKGAGSSLRVAQILYRPKSVAASQATTQRFQLETNCALQGLDFGAFFWDYLRSENVPGSYVTPLTGVIGTMTLLDSNTARFDYSGGAIYFTKHVGPLFIDPGPTQCD